MQNDKVWTKNFLLIIIINFLVFMNHIMILSTFPMFLEQVLGLNAAMAGLAAFGFSAVAVVLRPVIGWMLDCGRRKSVLLAGLAGMLLMPLGAQAPLILHLRKAPRFISVLRQYLLHPHPRIMTSECISPRHPPAPFAVYASFPAPRGSLQAP